MTTRNRFWWVTLAVATLAAGYPFMVAVSLTVKFLWLPPQGGDNAVLVPFVVATSVRPSDRRAESMLGPAL